MVLIDVSEQMLERSTLILNEFFGPQPRSVGGPDPGVKYGAYVTWPPPPAFGMTANTSGSFDAKVQSIVL